MYVPPKLFRKSIEAVFNSKAVNANTNIPRFKPSQSEDEPELRPLRKRRRRGKRRKGENQCSEEVQASYSKNEAGAASGISHSSIQQTPDGYTHNVSDKQGDLSSIPASGCLGTENNGFIPNTSVCAAGLKRKFQLEVTEPFPVKYARTESSLSEKLASSNKTSHTKSVKKPTAIVF
ncbi:hypothetical protein K493DRAFT_312191, partial [Basidiobolus meristosporus CBS 931.73]